MKPLATGTFHSTMQFHDTRSQSYNRIKRWFSTQESEWEFNRPRIAATGASILVIFAALMIVILGVCGASPLAYTTGIALAFVADSLAFAKAPMRWVVAGFIASVVVNMSLTIYYIIHIF